MDSKAAEIIRQAKELKEECDITYAEIMDQMEQLDRSTVPSLSSVRRVFRDGSETRASSFNYEEVLLPIWNAMQTLSKKDRSVSERDMEIMALKSVLRTQAEELDRLVEINNHLQDRVGFLVSQIEKKDRRMDEKDELIKKLLEKVL